MQGYIDAELVPRIEQVFIVGREGLIQLDAVLDTGFNDTFCLPRKHFQACELLFALTKEYMLANGAVVSEEVYKGTIVFDNHPVEILMSLTDDDEALIGTKLLDGKIVTLDFQKYHIAVHNSVN